MSVQLDEFSSVSPASDWEGNKSIDSGTPASNRFSATSPSPLGAASTTVKNLIDNTARCLFSSVASDLRLDMSPLREFSPIARLSEAEIDFDEMNRVVLVWERCARNKQELVETEEEFNQFQVLREVCRDFSKKLNLGDCTQCQFYCCKDSAGKIQALMALRDHQSTSLELVYLLTNPNNIRASVNELENRVVGAGSFLLEVAENLAIQKQKVGVLLSALSAAVGFYKKNGYNQLGDSSYMQKNVSF